MGWGPKPPKPPTKVVVDVVASDQAGNALPGVVVLSSQGLQAPATNEIGRSVFPPHPKGWTSFSAHLEGSPDWHSGDLNIQTDGTLRPVMQVPVTPAYPPRLYRNPHAFGGRALCIEGTATPVVLYGTSAFRIPQLLLHNHQDEVEAFLQWGREHRLNYCAFFLSARNMYELHPQDGLNMLPWALELTGKYGFYTTIVPVADRYDKNGIEIRPNYDWGQHVGLTGEIAQRYPHSMVMVCNEPSQVWQRHTVQELAAWAAQIPADVPVSLGSEDNGRDELSTYFHGRTTFGTVNTDRSGSLFRSARHIKEAMHLSEKHHVYVIDQERNREMGDPDWHFAASGVERVCMLGGLFHSEAGKHAQIPIGQEAVCFQASRDAWDFVPADAWGTFANSKWPLPLPQGPVENFEALDGESRVYSLLVQRPTGLESYSVASHVSAEPRWKPGWQKLREDKRTRAGLYHLRQA